MKLRTAILDDEPLAIEILEDYVSKTTQLELVLASTDPFEVLKQVQQSKVDLLLLDIQMPELTGIQFMKIYQDKCQVIVTTAYSEFALDSYEYHVVDYLLKPISYDRFFKAIQKLRIKATQTSKRNDSDFLFVKNGYKTQKLNFEDIVYIKSSGDYIEFHLTNQSKILSLENLKEVIYRLPLTFVRLHKSYIIHLKYIDFLERNRAVTTTNIRIPIGESFKEQFFKQIKS